MKATRHLALGIPFAILFPLLGFKVFIAIVASVFIDADHLYILIKHKMYSWKKVMYLVDNINDIYKKDPDNAFKDIVYIFHTIEFNIVLLALSVNFPVLFYVWLGFVYHIICDIIHHKLHGMPIWRWLSFFVFLKGQRLKKS